MCLDPALVFAEGAAVDAATPTQQTRASELYEQGVKAFRTGKHAEAAGHFKSSYDVVASPNSHLMYARALRDAGKLDEAYEELALTQQEAGELAMRLPKYASTAESAEAELVELRKRVAALAIQVTGDSPEVTLFVGNRQVPRERWRSVAVAPGTVDVSARLPGGRRAWQSVNVAVGQVTKVELDLTASEPQAAAANQPAATSGTVDVDNGRDTGTRSGSLKPYAYVAGGVGALGLVTFAVFGSMSRATHSDLEDSCPNGVCPPERQDDIDKGKSQQTIANIGLAVGIIGIGAGVTLFVLDEKKSSGHTRPRLMVGAGPGSLDLRGSF